MASSTTKVGAHVEREGPLEAAAELGADCVQIFLSDPGLWRKPPPHPDAEALRASPIAVYVHAPYLINVCSPKPTSATARARSSSRPATRRQMSARPR